jgi:nucleoside-diphosphate-sugar epimerase
MRILVTGGAGFIGSHLVDLLMERKDTEVVVLDNLSAGRLENLARWEGNPRFRFIQGDCLWEEDLERAMEGCEVVFHLAANPEVRVGAVDPTIDFNQNLVATHKLLEVMRRKGVRELLFASTSTVYGDAEVLPTPEDAPLRPISMYGASKLACEALISAYCHTFDFRAVCIVSPMWWVPELGMELSGTLYRSSGEIRMSLRFWVMGLKGNHIFMSGIASRACCLPLSMRDKGLRFTTLARKVRPRFVKSPKS